MIFENIFLVVIYVMHVLLAMQIIMLVLLILWILYGRTGKFKWLFHDIFHYHEPTHPHITLGDPIVRNYCKYCGKEIVLNPKKRIWELGDSHISVKEKA